MLIIFALLIFILIAATTYKLLITYAPMQSSEETRLKALASATKNQVEMDPEMDKSFRERVFLPLTQWAATGMIRFTPQSIRQMLQTKFTMAGGFAGLTVDQFLGVSGALAIVFAVGMATLVSLTKLSEKVLLLSIVAGEIGLMLPYLALRLKIAKRIKSMQKALPDALDLLTVSVEAGLGFDGALLKLSEKMHGPLVDEFARTLQEMRMGVPRREAFYALSARCNMQDISTFTSALIQADQLGASLSTVLRVQSVAMREIRRQRTEEKAQKAPIFMLIPLVFCIFPAIFIVLLGPAAIKISESILK